MCVPCLMSSVHEMDCLREETVPVSGRSGAQSSVASTRQFKEGALGRELWNSSKRECAGCEGSRVILPALLLTLDKYSSWRVGRVVPMIRSAVRTTLRSLLRFGFMSPPMSKANLRPCPTLHFPYKIFYFYIFNNIWFLFLTSTIFKSEIKVIVVFIW